jgi:hypothetical protein
MIEEARQLLHTSSGAGGAGGAGAPGAAEKLVLQELLGEGSFGKVYKGLCEWQVEVGV